MNTHKVNGKDVTGEGWQYYEEDGIHQAYYPNGQIESEYRVLNHKLHGLYREWYTNGQLECEHNYQNGRRHGLFKGWQQNGQTRYERIYVNNIDRTKDLRDNKLAQVVVFGKVIL